MTRRILTVLAAVMSLAVLTSCGKSSSSSAAESASSASKPSNDSVTSAAPADSASSDSASTADPEVLTAKAGAITFFPVAEGEDPFPEIRGLRIAGNVAGSTEFNSRDTKTEGIRCIFELNEWMEFYPDTDADYGLKVWIIEHKDDASYYQKNKVTDLTPGFKQYCELYHDTEAEPGSAWGSCYLNPEEAQPGLYDFVITYEGKSVGVMLVKIFQEEELNGKSDDDIEALMKF